jgi:hypothetical protein
MSRDRDRDRDLIDALLLPIVARAWRRILRRQVKNGTSDMQKSNPDICMVCAYTSWMNDEGARLGHLDHSCIEGRDKWLP